MAIIKDDQPHLTYDQKVALLNVQYSMAMAGDTDLLRHLGSTELGQVKVLPSNLDTTLPMAMLTLERMYELLELRRKSESIEGSVTQVLDDRAESVNGFRISNTPIMLNGTSGRHSDSTRFQISANSNTQSAAADSKSLVGQTKHLPYIEAGEAFQSAASATQSVSEKRKGLSDAIAAKLGVSAPASAAQPTIKVGRKKGRVRKD